MAASRLRPRQKVARCTTVRGLERLQILDEIPFLRWVESQTARAIVMRNYVVESGGAAILVAPYPHSPAVAPVLWCLVGALVTFLQGVPQVLGRVVAGVVDIVLIASSRLPDAQAAVLL